MARDDNDKFEIKTDDRDVDRTAKKLRSLDKLLQQTQRRAALLSKTRIKPILTLDDRLTSAARKAEEALERLHRTTVKPTAQLSDRVTTTALRIRASLAAMAAEPWQVSIAGVNWETVVGDSFSKWMKSDGKSTLGRVSAAIGEALGEGIKSKIIESLGIGIDEASGGKGLNSGGSRIWKRANPPLLSLPVFPMLDAYDYLSNRLADRPRHSIVDNILSMLNPITIAENSMRGNWGPVKVTQKVFSGMGKAFEPISALREDHPNIINSIKSVLEFGGKVINEIFKDRYKEALESKLTQAANSVKKYWLEKWPGWRSQLETKISPKKLDQLSAAGTKGAQFWGKRVTPFVKKIGGYAGLLMDGYEIFSAKPGRERTQKVTSAILGGLLGAGGAALGTFTAPVTGGWGTLLFPALGAAAGDSLGELLGGYIFDVLYGKKKTKPLVYSNRVMAPSVQGVTRPGTNVNVPKVMGTPVPNYYQLPEEVKSKIGGAGYKQAPTPVNVSLSEGSINLTVNEEKLDYQKLAETAGWKIANEVRFAMQNLK
ncbi:hypothetical protein POTG_01547 [Paenibacillus sp. oral taxon 786 str. D14]|uniref:hypothetical protein n=1 Tax=Paenibacillus sp. oral taxon 786 TaxID=652715 RepID=UPI0001AFCFC0|nr:hypothetical protein [Paenibacillus sp. oral taxon 786]EES73840.1 hypothetical protein POTG_01547 [Paenibacillus sp. oral taxon 786 str. D14]